MPTDEEREQALERELEALRQQEGKAPTDPALKTAKPKKQAPIDECHPDVWDENGRLISHTAFTEVK